MSLFGKWYPALLAAAVWLAGAGCSPMDQGPLDEEKEPHYVLGKSRVNAMNYSGAIEAFEASLEANPHSAQAHYQLAMLFENPEYGMTDAAAAIYHYQQYLKFDPKAGNVDVIGQHITRCKQQLAQDSLALPSTPAAQQQLEKLAEENRRLHDQVSQWQAYYASQQAAAATNPPAPQNTSPTPEDVTPARAAATTTSSTAAVTPSTSTAARRNAMAPRVLRTRTHTVASGETLASIARKQGISLTSLQAANPGVNPKKLKAGQVLNLPAQ